MNMKQSCKALICAIEGELDGRHCTEEQAAAILDHALPSLTEALARAEAARDLLRDQCQSYISTGNEVLAERDTAQAKLADVLYILDQHRAWTGMGWEQLPVPVHAVEKIRSKLAQAEQQEAQGAQAVDGLDAVAEAIFNADKDNWFSVGPYPQLHANDKARLRAMARAALATQPAEWADQLYTQGFDAGAAASKRLNAVRGSEHE